MNTLEHTFARDCAGLSAGKQQPRRVLFVAYAFPPVGGVSVQRISKFVKYLPQSGWTSSVLTVENPSVPMFDASLMAEIPEGTLVRRARTLEPGYAIKASVGAGDAQANGGISGRVLQAARGAARRAANVVLQPDTQILWRPHALREGTRLLREIRHDAIVATGPPFSSMLLGLTLAKRARIPLVLDYRDEWSFMTYWENKQFGSIENAVQSRMQDRVLAGADLVLTTTPASARALRALVAAAGGTAAVDHIYNGFDPPDFPDAATFGTREDFGAGNSRFRLSFVGTLWNVTPIAPVVEAILALVTKSPELARQLEFVVAGRRTSQQDEQLDRLVSTPVHLVRRPFVTHKDAIRMMCQSDALLLINADLPDTERLINAKTFEYMATRRPIVLVAPRGELWRMLAELPDTSAALPGDVAAISENIKAAILRWQSGETGRVEPSDLAKYERCNLAGELAGHLDALVGARSGQQS